MPSTVTQAAEQLNIAPDDVAALLSAGALVDVDDRGRPMLPTWQFDTDRPGGALPCTGKLLTAFSGDVVGLSLWITSPSPAFAGRTRRTALADGQDRAVVDAASTLTAAGW